MYRRIVVPVDGSGASFAALDEAARLAQEQQASLRIVYVVDEAPVVAGSEFGDMLGVEEAELKSAKKVLDGLSGKYPDAEIRIIETTRSGQRVSEAIVEDAEGWGADLLVAGTHGRTGLRHLLMGSVAEGVVRAAKIPVLLVKERH